MSSKMEQIIEEIEEYIDGCKYQPLSNTRIIVNKEELEELIAELRSKTPEEIKRYQKIISNKEAILADAQAKADQIIAQAQIQTSELVSEHQIMQQAYAQANEVVMIATKQAQEILDNATNEANSIRMGAMNYTDEQLRGIEDILTNSIETSQARYDSLVSSLQGFLDVVSQNRAQLFPQESEATKTESKSSEKSEERAQESEITTISVSDGNPSEENE
ncbi:MAG: ATPase [Lachnospiraceae bacterium]|nr:ATPase [Agathobacter sp.]MDD6291497.1 ATPase [Lachnospiraceae bacterium]